MTASYNRDGGRKTESGMAAEYDEFECRLRERLLTIAEEIETAKESGRASLADPTNKIGRALAAQQIKIKEAERSRVAAMLAGVQQQQSELQMATFTSDYVKLMQTSSRVGPSLSKSRSRSSMRTRTAWTHARGRQSPRRFGRGHARDVARRRRQLFDTERRGRQRGVCKTFGVPAAPGLRPTGLGPGPGLGTGPGSGGRRLPDCAAARSAERAAVGRA